MTDATNAASLFDMFETSEVAEQDGIWVPVGPASFKLARMGGSNTKFNKKATKTLKPFQASMDSIPEKLAHKMSVDIFVGTVLLDWKGVVEKDGTELPWSEDNAKSLLNRLPNLLLALQAEASKLGNFNSAQLEAGAKN